MAITTAELVLTDELFTHLVDGASQATYAVTRLKRRCLAGDIPVMNIPVDGDHAAYCLEHRGVEMERLAALIAEPKWLCQPLVFVTQPDASQLLVDGTHRYVLFFRLGLTTCPAYIVPWTVGQDFIVVDAPSTNREELMQPSHIVTMRKLFGTGDEGGGGS